MDDETRVLLDKQCIYEVLARYCRGADRCDEDLIRSVYHEDAYDDHGYWKGKGHDFAVFLPARLTKANSATTHSITNVLIDVHGDEAWSESQVVATLVRKNTHPTRVDIMGARYHDRFSRRNGAWKIDRRTVVLDWNKTEVWSDKEAPVPIDDFSRGGRWPDDPVYTLLKRQ